MPGDAHVRMHGKWHSVLLGLGDSRLDEKTLSGRNVKCPMCGGKDRFRFDDKNMGMWYCNKCGAGDGFKLLQQLLNLTFKEAKDKVDPLSTTAERRVKQELSSAAKTRMIFRITNDCLLGDGRLKEYLLSRGIDYVPADVRIHPELHYKDDDGANHTDPAIIIPYYTLIDGKRELCTVLRRWLIDGVKKKMLMPPIYKADAIFATMGQEPKDGWLGVAEGWENALAYKCIVRQLTGHDMPVWSAYSAESLIRFQPPEDVKRLHICMDVDVSYTGQHASYALAKRIRHERPWIDCRIVRPCPNDGQDYDFNDKLQDMNRHEQIRQSKSDQSREPQAVVQS